MFVSGKLALHRIGLCLATRRYLEFYRPGLRNSHPPINAPLPIGRHRDRTLLSFNRLAVLYQPADD